MLVSKNELKELIQQLFDQEKRPYTAATRNKLRTSIVEAIGDTCMVEILEFKPSHPSYGIVTVNVIQYNAYMQFVRNSFNYYGVDDGA